jgi:tetratricopeptide (TPR) repeat protein
MRRRDGARLVIALVAVTIAVAIVGCAPRMAPPPSGGALRYPDFMFPAAPAALLGAGQATRMQRGWQALQAGDAAGARREFSEALRANPMFYPADVGLGYASLAERKLAEAVDSFTRALTRDSRYVPALVGRGDALAGEGRLDDAIRDLEAAVAAQAALTDVRGRLDVLVFRHQQETLQTARTAAGAGRLDEAAADYQRAIERSPDSALLYKELAGVERRQGKTDQAAEHLRKAVSLDPSDARAFAQLGEVLEARGEFGAAADAYGRAVSLEPGEEMSARVAAARALASVSRLPPQFQAIAKAPEITRGDLAALLGARLRALLNSAPRRDAVVVTDVRGQWAASWIAVVMAAGIMEPYPNHTFGPGNRVARLDLARVASRVLNLIGARRPMLAREWQAARPQISDLPSDHLGYAAAALVVAAGVMPLAEGAAFNPKRPVSGVEAIDVVTRLEGLLR